MDKKSDIASSLPMLKDAKTPREKVMAYMDCMTEHQIERLLSMAELIFTR